jgi:hypothetical protein
MLFTNIRNQPTEIHLQVVLPTINAVGSAPVKLCKPSRPPETTNQQKTQRDVEHVEITNSKELHVMVGVLTMMGLSVEGES